MEGYLLKLTSRKLGNNTWKKRWFVIAGHYLKQYKDAESVALEKASAIFDLRNLRAVRADAVRTNHRIPTVMLGRASVEAITQQTVWAMRLEWQADSNAELLVTELRSQDANYPHHWMEALMEMLRASMSYAAEKTRLLMGVAQEQATRAEKDRHFIDGVVRSSGGQGGSGGGGAATGFMSARPKFLVDDGCCGVYRGTFAAADDGGNFEDGSSTSNINSSTAASKSSSYGRTIKEMQVALGSEQQEEGSKGSTARGIYDPIDAPSVRARATTSSGIYDPIDAPSVRARATTSSGIYDPIDCLDMATLAAAVAAEQTTTDQTTHSGINADRADHATHTDGVDHSGVDHSINHSINHSPTAAECLALHGATSIERISRKGVTGPACVEPSPTTLDPHARLRQEAVQVRSQRSYSFSLEEIDEQEEEAAEEEAAEEEAAEEEAAEEEAAEEKAAEESNSDGGEGGSEAVGEGGVGDLEHQDQLHFRLSNVSSCDQDIPDCSGGSEEEESEEEQGEHDEQEEQEEQEEQDEEEEEGSDGLECKEDDEEEPMYPLKEPMYPLEEPMYPLGVQAVRHHHGSRSMGSPATGREPLDPAAAPSPRAASADMTSELLASLPLQLRLERILRSKLREGIITEEEFDVLMGQQAQHTQQAQQAQHTQQAQQAQQTQQTQQIQQAHSVSEQQQQQQQQQPPNLSEPLDPLEPLARVHESIGSGGMAWGQGAEGGDQVNFLEASLDTDDLRGYWAAQSSPRQSPVTSPVPVASLDATTADAVVPSIPSGDAPAGRRCASHSRDGSHPTHDRRRQLSGMGLDVLARALHGEPGSTTSSTTSSSSSS
jgi:hypothetical protein